MSDDLYERYKEALRVGHVAVLRGSLAAAIDAYRTAAEIAPSRALPHTSLGGVLLRLGQVEDALVEYAAAVARAPRDEGALLGQAEALATAGRGPEAADALDRVAALQVESGRLPEAADTLRRALEQSETAERLQRQRDLIDRVRLSAGDQAAEKLLARAMRPRDDAARTAALAHAAEPAMTAEGAVEPIPETPIAEPETEIEVEPAAAAVADAAEPGKAVGEPAAVEPEPVAARRDGWADWWDADRATSLEEELAEPATPFLTFEAAEPRPADVADAAELEEATAAIAHEVTAEPEALEPVAAEPVVPEPVAEAPVPAPVAEAVPSAPVRPHEETTPALVGVMAAHPETASEPQPSGDELLAAAEAADVAGDTVKLRALLLDTARAYAREARFESALDAAHRLLQSAPSDLETHLVLVELYIARDWNALARDKLELLERLAELTGDEEARQRVTAVATRAFPRDERFGSAA